jgi:peptidoglycan-associated lipoprotein
MKKILLGFVVLGLLAGCKSAPLKEEAKPVEEKSVQPGAEAGAVTGAPLETGKLTAPPKDATGGLAQRSIYYDFDSYVVKDEYRPIVQAHAKFLQDNPNARVTLQGNCDERGSEEYNLALGQRRSDSLKKMMTVQGVPDKEVDTLSFGKTKPRNRGHDEAAWQENRRVDLVYQGE